MKHFVTNSEIQSNVISNCGVHDFRFGEGGLNGEGIYVGTSSNQVNEKQLAELPTDFGQSRILTAWLQIAPTVVPWRR